MLNRPLVSIAAGSALLLGALSATPAAAAATAASAAKGHGTSTLSVLTLTAGGHTLTLGGVSLVSDTIGGSPLASATITPAVVDGTAYGRQTITPANSPVSVPAVTTPSALAGIASLTSPVFTASATSAPASKAGASSLGAVSLLGLNVPVNGELLLGSGVSSTGAIGQKSVNIKNLSLPSIGAILAALGLDVSKLPAGTVGSLVTQLNIATSAISNAQAAVDTAQAQVASAAAALSAAQATLVTKTADSSAATAAVTAATAALNAKLAQISPATLTAFPGANTITGYAGLSSLGTTAVENNVPGTAAAYSALTAAQAAVAPAAAAVTTAQAAVDAAQAQLTALTATLQTALGTLDGLALPVLNATPLVSLDGLAVGSKALTTSNKAGGQVADITGGTITGLHVLGTDVLQAVLGSSSLNVVDMAGTTAATVNTAISQLTGTLSSVLSTIPSLPALDVPAPKVEVLTRTLSTSISGGFGHASNSLQGIRITLPAIALPSAVALPNASALPAFTGAVPVAGVLNSSPVSLGLATVADESAFAPAVVPGGTVPTVTPTLPRTGLPIGVGVLALLTLSAGLVLRRRHAISANES